MRQNLLAPESKCGSVLALQPEKYLDAYTIRARLAPALIVMLPLALCIIAWFPGKFLGLGLLLGAAVWCGATFLLAELGRDLGKEKEASLFAQWGGAPTTKMLRHRDRISLELPTKQRYHRALTQLTGLSFPSAQEEANKPEEADQQYKSAIRFLRQVTATDRERFRLVFQELINYGFRRNLWGLKPFGVTTSTLGFLVAFPALALDWARVGDQPTPLIVVGVNGALFVIWATWITPSWVRTAAFAYAERLLAACDDLTIPYQSHRIDKERR